jgi:hypothetical protein
MTDDERRAADEADRALYLERLDRRLRNIARRKEKERKQARSAYGARARSADQWAHVGLRSHHDLDVGIELAREEREAEERMRDREREASKLAMFRDEHTNATAAMDVHSTADDDDNIPILRYWKYEEEEELQEDAAQGSSGEDERPSGLKNEGHCDDDDLSKRRRLPAHADEGAEQGMNERPLLWDGDDAGSSREQELVRAHAVLPRKGRARREKEEKKSDRHEPDPGRSAWWWLWPLAFLCPAQQR